MKLVLILLEVIILSGFAISYANLKWFNNAKNNIDNSGFSVLAEAVPDNNGSPDSRGRGSQGNKFQEDKTEDVKSC
ncbi:hypothetical protein [Floridanema evergladense]|uniref:Uncharacterized protein n=1 Tax=Floridaenema evergladense BLCC-F167 TaxID=3153639 RepID=A0ABV4WVY6_9CYAN